jgi:stress response protein SCP2
MISYFQRGQRGPLGGAPAASAAPALEVEVELHRGRIRSDLDLCCLCLGAEGRLADDRYLVFYNQPVSPEGAVAWHPAPGPGAGGRFRVELGRLPAAFERLVFTASIDGAERMSDLERGEIRLRPEGAADGIAHAFAGGDFVSEQTLLLGEVYRRNGEWRFWAVGQGFAGGLAAVLEHFGARVEGDTVSAASGGGAPPPPPPAQARPAPTVVAPHGETALQRLIDGAPAGGVLVLPRNEYEGPGTVDKPLVVEGNGSTLWSRTGPVLRVASPGVELRAVGLEVTVRAGGGDAALALDIAPGCAPRLDRVQVRGGVRGLEEEAGEWALPGSLSLGAMPPRERSEFRLALRVPVACRLTSAVSGVLLLPEALHPGDNEVTLRVEGVGSETLIAGEILLDSPHLQRTIALTGSTVGAEGSPPVRGALLWSPGAHDGATIP